MSNTSLTLTIKSVYGRLCAYPIEPVLSNLLNAKNTVKRNGKIIKATCFNAYDVATWLPDHLDKIGADLVEVYQLTNKNDEQRWKDEKRMFQ